MFKRKDKKELSAQPELESNATPDYTRAEVNEVNFTHKAYGIHKIITENGAVYNLVEIEYDPDSGASGGVNVIHKDVFEDVVDRFKMTVAESLFTRT